MSKDYIRVGDRVMWRGGFGFDTPEVATVTGLSVTTTERSKYGRDVKRTSWDKVYANKCVVSLDKGNWAYGEQIKKHITPNTVKFITEEE